MEFKDLSEEEAQQGKLGKTCFGGLTPTIILQISREAELRLGTESHTERG